MHVSVHVRGYAFMRACLHTGPVCFSNERMFVRVFAPRLAVASGAAASATPIVPGLPLLPELASAHRDAPVRLGTAGASPLFDAG